MPRPGVGLAATQVDVHKQLIVIDISETHDNLLVLINPQILESRGKVGVRGRLPVGSGYLRESHPRRMGQGARPRSGWQAVYQSRQPDCSAVCIQHEMDHLKGKVFVEYLSRLKQSRIVAQAEEAAAAERL